MKLVLLSLLFVFASAVSHGFCGSDLLLSTTVETESQTCTTSGYCGMYDLTEAGEYEYFYGYHSNCEGRQEKQIEKLLCQRPDLTTYEDRSEGVWGSCIL